MKILIGFIIYNLIVMLKLIIIQEIELIIIGQNMDTLKIEKVELFKLTKYPK